MLFDENKKWFIGSIEFSAACDFVDKIHRHNKRPVGHIFSLALWIDKDLVGVAICGRPVGRHLDNGDTIEVYRNCIKEGVSNGCSMLYGACIRMANKKGFKRVITFTKMSETGGSVKAANFILEAENVGGKKWSGKRKYVCESKELKKRWVHIQTNERKVKKY